MHYHCSDAGPNHNHTYCEDHARLLVEGSGEYMYACGCESGEREGCIICEEHDEIL